LEFYQGENGVEFLLVDFLLGDVVSFVLVDKLRLAGDLASDLTIGKNDFLLNWNVLDRSVNK
jgi:hypothetical protein